MSALQWFGVIALSIVVLLFVLGSLFGHASRNRAKYKGVSFSREDILAKVNSDFAESERAFVIEQLERLGPLGEKFGWVGQAQFSALVLADRDIKALPQYCDVSIQGDTRDIIAKAGLG